MVICGARKWAARRRVGVERRRGVVVGECEEGRGVFMDECGAAGRGNQGGAWLLASTKGTGCGV